MKIGAYTIEEIKKIGEYLSDEFGVEVVLEEILEMGDRKTGRYSRSFRLANEWIEFFVTIDRPQMVSDNKLGIRYIAPLRVNSRCVKSKWGKSSWGSYREGGFYGYLVRYSGYLIVEDFSSFVAKIEKEI